MGNLGMSNFLTSMVEGMNKAKQSQVELAEKKEKLKFEQDKLKLEERKMQMQYREDPFESLTKQLDLNYKAAQTEKAQFDLVDSQRKAQEVQALRGLQIKAGEDIAKKVEYYRTQGIKPRGAQLDELMNLYRITGDSPTEIQTTLETQGFIPRYKPESPKESKEDPLIKFKDKQVEMWKNSMAGISALSSLSEDEYLKEITRIETLAEREYNSRRKEGGKGGSSRAGVAYPPSSSYPQGTSGGSSGVRKWNPVTKRLE